MAEDLYDGGFLLPSQFLTDDDIISEKQHINNKGSPEITSPRFTWEASNGFGSCGSSSVLSSPVKSEMSSTGTESEEEDYIAELTRQMAHYMLQEDDKRDSQNTKLFLKSWDFADSRPQKLTPGFEDAKNSNDWTLRNQPCAHDQLQAIQFHQVKQQQLMKQKGRVYREPKAKIARQLEPKQELQHMKNRGRACGGFVNGRNSRPLVLSSSSCPRLQQQQQQLQNQQTGSGMRAVFLKGSGSRSGSCGTGVFLPPGIVNSSESRKKPGCSTVLIPARVAQALKLHFDNMGSALSPYNAAAFPLQHEASMGGNRGIFSQQKNHTQNLPGMNRHEMGLPQEWTY